MATRVKSSASATQRRRDMKKRGGRYTKHTANKKSFAVARSRKHVKKTGRKVMKGGYSVKAGEKVIRIYKDNHFKCLLVGVTKQIEKDYVYLFFVSEIKPEEIQSIIKCITGNVIDIQILNQKLKVKELYYFPCDPVRLNLFFIKLSGTGAYKNVESGFLDTSVFDAMKIESSIIRDSKYADDWTSIYRQIQENMTPQNINEYCIFPEAEDEYEQFLKDENKEQSRKEFRYDYYDYYDSTMEKYNGNDRYYRYKIKKKNNIKKSLKDIFSDFKHLDYYRYENCFFEKERKTKIVNDFEELNSSYLNVISGYKTLTQPLREPFKKLYDKLEPKDKYPKNYYDLLNIMRSEPKNSDLMPTLVEISKLIEEQKNDIKTKIDKSLLEKPKTVDILLKKLEFFRYQHNSPFSIEKLDNIIGTFTEVEKSTPKSDPNFVNKLIEKFIDYRIQFISEYTSDEKKRT